MKHTLQELKDFSNKWFDSNGLCSWVESCTESCPFFSNKKLCYFYAETNKGFFKYRRLNGYIKRFPSILLEEDK